MNGYVFTIALLFMFLNTHCDLFYPHTLRYPILTYLCLVSFIFLPAYYRSREEWNALIEGCGFKRGMYEMCACLCEENTPPLLTRF